MPEDIAHMVEELDFRYRDNYVGLENTSKGSSFIAPYHIDRVSRNELGTKIVFNGRIIPERGKPANHNLIFKDISEVNFIIPTLGMVNSTQGCVWLSRLPARQYQKGFTGNIIRSHSVSEDELHAVGKRSPDWSSPGMLRKIFNPSYNSAGTAIRKVREFDTLSSAFSKDYYVVNKRAYQKPLVGYKNVIIGYVTDANVIQLMPAASHLYEELSEYIPCIRSTKNV